MLFKKRVSYFTTVVFITPAAVDVDVAVWAVAGADTLITISLSGFLAGAVVTWWDNNTNRLQHVYENKNAVITPMSCWYNIYIYMFFSFVSCCLSY